MAQQGDGPLEGGGRILSRCPSSKGTHEASGLGGDLGSTKRRRDNESEEEEGEKEVECTLRPP